MDFNVGAWKGTVQPNGTVYDDRTLIEIMRGELAQANAWREILNQRWRDGDQRPVEQKELQEWAEIKMKAFPVYLAEPDEPSVEQGEIAVCKKHVVFFCGNQPCDICALYAATTQLTDGGQGPEPERTPLTTETNSVDPKRKTGMSLTNERQNFSLWWLPVVLFIALTFWTQGFFAGRTYESRKHFCQTMREMGDDMKGYCDGF